MPPNGGNLKIAKFREKKIWFLDFSPPDYDSTMRGAEANNFVSDTFGLGGIVWGLEAPKGRSIFENSLISLCFQS